jgi:hypothetical protein
MIPRGSRPSVSLAEMDLRLDGARLKRFEVPQPAGPPEVDKAVMSGPYSRTAAAKLPAASASLHRGCGGGVPKTLLPTSCG